MSNYLENKIKVLEGQTQDKQTTLNLLASYSELITLVNNKDFQYSKIICKKGIALSKKTQHTEFNVKFEKELGIVYTCIGDYKKAEQCFINALEQVKKTNNIEAQIGLLLNLGLVCIKIKQEDEGYKKLYKAAELANDNLDKVSNRLVMSIYINLGNIHNDLGLYQSAQEYLTKALETINKGEDNYLYNKGRILWYLGVNYNHQKNFELSEKNLKESLAILTGINVQNEIFYNYTAFSTLYRDFKHFESSLKFALKAIDLALKLKSPKYEYIAAEIVINILLLFSPNAKLYKELACTLTYDQLLNKIEEIVLLSKNATLILGIYKIKSNFYKETKRLESSLEYKEKVIESLENKYEEENKVELGKVKAKNKIQQKEKEFHQQIKLLTKEKKANIKLQLINKNIEEQNQIMVQKTNELQNILRELENFAFITSHDLKEPLRSIHSFLQLLKIKYSDVLDEKGLTYIDFSLQGADRIKKLIEDLLLYTKLSNQQHSFTTCDLNKTLQLVIKELKPNIEDVHLSIINTKKLPNIIANKEMMQLLFHHLISNAIKYTGDKKPSIEIAHSINQGNIVLSFKDNGIGIDEGFQNKIFDIFRRLHNNDTHKGTGIGLTICKKIVTLHKGNIWFESTLGQGATFFVELPLK